MIITDWQKEYDKNQSTHEYHTQALDSIVEDNFFYSQEAAEVLAVGWLNVAIFNNHTLAIDKLLDIIGIVQDNRLKTKERLAIYLLHKITM